MEKKVKFQPKRTSAPRVDFKETSFERNFITPGRAMTEFLLKPSQLEGLPKNFRRSPYEQELSILMFNRKDVENRALQVWGSPENLEQQRIKRDQNKQLFEQYSYEAKKTLREARRSAEKTTERLQQRRKREATIIALAITVDLLNFCFKLLMWTITRSDSMLAEAIHSAADTLNQSILVIGILQTGQGSARFMKDIVGVMVLYTANPRHPYGYSNAMYVVSLISGVGIFCLGAAVSAFKGAETLMYQKHVINYDEMKWAFAVLGFSFFTEFITLSSTIIAIRKGAKKNKISFFLYIARGMEPGITVVLMEDGVAVLGTITAASLLGFSWRIENDMPDAVGCIVIGFLLGIVALFLIVTNAAALVGRSIPKERLEHINNAIESDVMVRAIHDVKGIDIGNSLVRYKAEIDFDGEELARLYLDRVNLNDLLKEVKAVETIDDLEAFMLSHGENIVDLMGGEIDRIEIKIRNQFPEIRHVDLEIL